MRSSRTVLAHAVVLTSALAITGCSPAGGGGDVGGSNVQACADIEDLWERVADWGGFPGNTDDQGRPTDGGSSAPDFHEQLDAIRMTTGGGLRAVLDDYYVYAPTGGEWWYSSGTHQSGQASAVQSACAQEGASIDFPE